jgi:cytochrome c-type biogenesis protein CcmH/NrfG
MDQTPGAAKPVPPRSADETSEAFLNLEPLSPGERPAPSEVPDRLGKYEILARLGQGAMGVVYHAHDPLLDRDVALKVMLTQVAEDPEQKLRFEREARAVARMMHPNVVTVFDLGYHTNGAPYIAMELLRGHDLLHTLRNGPYLTLDRKLAIILQVLEGLGHAHAAGIVHRDIKPANVFIPDGGVAKIMDFGVARFTMSSVTSTGVVVGTADYMSPEQVSGVRVDGRSDLFSTGAMLCELLTGHRPFHGESLVTILFRITHEEPRLDLPPGPEHAALVPILRKALAKDVADRYQTAAEFVDALQAYLAKSPASAGAADVPFTDGDAGTASEGTGVGRTQETMDFGPLVLSLDFSADAPVQDVAVLPKSAPAPTFAPPVDPLPVFQVLRGVHAGSKSGHLHFFHGGGRRSLRFLEGQVLHGTSDTRGEHLGDVLVRYGRLRQADLDQAVAIVLRDRRRLGGVLLAMGLLDRSGLDEAVGLHAREILFDAMGQSDGSFTFEESGPEPLGPDDAASNLSTVELILEAARRVQDPAVVRRVLRNLDQVPVVARDAFNRFRNIALTPADGFLLSRIDGKAMARDLFKLIPLPAEDVERSLFGLLSTGVVEYRVAALPVKAAPRPSPRPVPVPPSPQPSPTPRPAAFLPPHPTGASEARRDLEAEKARREAEEKAIEATRTMILEAYEGLETRDHFEFMNIPRNATDLQVKESYFRMARPFHPDTRLDPRLADLLEKREAVFIRLGHAYEALRTTASRARYAANLSARPSAPAPDEPPFSEAAHAAWLAHESLLSAEEHHREGRYWDAIQLLESTIPRLEGAEKLRARVALARAQMKNPNWVKRAEESLHVLLQEHPHSVEAVMVLAELYRSTQMRSRALAMYRRVLEIDRDNKDAQAAVRFLQSAEGPSPETGKLFKKLFGNKP